MENKKRVLPFNEYLNELNESRRETHVFNIIRGLRNIDGVKDILDIISLVDGMAAVVSHEDGNAYEIIVRPAAYAQFKDDYGNLLKKKGEENDDDDEDLSDVPRWWEE